MLCRKQALGAVLAALGVGFLISAVIGSGVLAVLLGVLLIGLGCIISKSR